MPKSSRRTKIRSVHITTQRRTSSIGLSYIGTEKKGVREVATKLSQFINMEHYHVLIQGYKVRREETNDLYNFTKVIIRVHI